MKIIKQAAEALKQHYILAGIIIFGFALRVYGIYFDYPTGVNFIWDEIFSVSYLLDIVDQKTLFTSSPYQYPLLLPILYIPGLAVRMFYFVVGHSLYGINEIKDFLVDGGMGQLYIVVRWYSVFFGTATMYLLYKIYRPLFKNIWSVYFAVFAYSISFIPVYLSHWGKAHSAMIFFFVLSLYFVLRFEREKAMRLFWLSVMASAAAFSIHYIGISAIIFPLAGWWFNRGYFTWKKTVCAGSLYGGIALFFYLSNWNGVVSMFWNTAEYFQRTDFTGMAKVGIFERLYYLFFDSFKLEPFLILFAIVFLFNIKKIAKDRFLRYIFAGLCFNYLLMVTIIAWPEMARWRGIFITLMLPLSAGFAMEYMLENKFKKTTMGVVIFLLIAPSVYITGSWLKILNHNTRIDAVSWLEDNTNGEMIYTFDRYLDAPLNYDSALWHRDNNNRGLSKKLAYIIGHEEEFKHKGLNLRYDYDMNRFRDLGGPNTKYIFISYWPDKNGGKTLFGTDVGSLLNEVEKYHRIERVKTFFPVADGVKVSKTAEDILNNPINWIDVVSLEKSGPFVEIYRVIN